jgi:hypothetical protein
MRLAEVDELALPDVPLTQAMKAWHEKLPSATVLQLRESLSKAPSITVGTACSGTDVSVQLLEWMSSYWHSEYGVEVLINQKFACEKDPAVQSFLTSQFPNCEALLPETAMLGSRWAQRVGGTKSSLLKVPSVDIYLAGFLCTARSKANPRIVRRR